MNGFAACRCFAFKIALVAALGVSTTATAGPPQAPPPARAARGGAAPTGAELGTILDAYAIVQAQNALQLDDEQYGRFVSRLKRLQDTRRRGSQARNRAVAELRKLTLGAVADDTVLRERLRALRELEDQSALAIRREHDALDEVLTPPQQVRFRIFEEQLERRKLDLLLRARNRAARSAQPRGDTDR